MTLQSWLVREMSTSHCAFSHRQSSFLCISIDVHNASKVAPCTACIIEDMSGTESVLVMLCLHSVSAVHFLVFRSNTHVHQGPSLLQKLLSRELFFRSPLDASWCCVNHQQRKCINVFLCGDVE